MTQSSVAVSEDGEAWTILNASPDIAAQLAATPKLHPNALRAAPMKAVVLTNGDIDHIAGLLDLREKSPFDIYATASGLEILRENSVFGVLDQNLVMKHPISLDTPFAPVGGLNITPFAVPGKVALFLEGPEVKPREVGEQTVGLLLETEKRRVAYIPGCASVPDWLLERICDVDLVLFDGTVWENDDMQRTGTGEKTGARMGHLPMAGSAGSLERLDGVEARKIFVHINNTNPVLQPDSPERAEVLSRGWEIACDGMEITL
jgi:pyrroloquinoline quinone biosynthesis protein B